MAEQKQKKQMYALAGLLVVAALVLYWNMDRPKKSKSGFTGGTALYQPINAQDFSAVFAGYEKAQSTEYKSSGKNIFIMIPLPPPPPDPKQLEAEKPVVVYNQPQPPPPPPPAQLPMKFFGYGTLPSGGPRRAFLLDGDEVHIVGEGEIVLNHIRITHIGNERIEFEDTNTGQRGSNQLEPMGPAA